MQTILDEGGADKSWTLKTSDKQVLNFDINKNVYNFETNTLKEALSDFTLTNLALLLSDGEGRNEINVTTTDISNVMTLRALYGYGINELVQMAKNDGKVMQALVDLSTFATMEIEGIAVNESNYKDYSDAYLQKRAEMLYYYIEQNKDYFDRKIVEGTIVVKLILKKQEVRM